MDNYIVIQGVRYDYVHLSLDDACEACALRELCDTSEAGPVCGPFDPLQLKMEFGYRKEEGNG